MALHGKGMLAVFTDVKLRDEADFNEWYNREHIDERINLPGFHRARRYISVRGAPRYLATYECDTVADLVTPGYLALLANQTPWSQATMARFTHFFTRMTLRIQMDMTHGEGGALTTVRFVPDLRNRHALVAWLEATLTRTIALPNMLGAAVGENDLDAANAPAQQKSMDQPKALEAEWMVMLEGADPKVTAAVARENFKLAALKKFGVKEAPVVGTYRFIFGNQR